jgi:hypothetical protein
MMAWTGPGPFAEIGQSADALLCVFDNAVDNHWLTRAGGAFRVWVKSMRIGCELAFYFF